METKSLKASSIEKDLFGVEPCGRVEVDVSELNPKYNYWVINAVGNCLDSDLCHIRVRDGDKILIHQIPMNEWDILNNVGNVVCFMLKSGKAYIKQLVFWDGVSWGIRVKMFVPQEIVFFVPLDKMKALFVVDKAFSPEYIKNIQGTK